MQTKLIHCLIITSSLTSYLDAILRVKMHIEICLSTVYTYDHKIVITCEYHHHIAF